MSQAPYMPVFTDALLGDTLHLSAEEFGAYCLILFATWRNNGQPLPDDDAELARIARISQYKWKKVRQKLAGFFEISSGFWRQKRLEKEWAYVQQRAAVKRKNGSKGGRAKVKNGKLSLDENPSYRGSTHTHTHTQKEENQPPPPPESPKPRARAATGRSPDGEREEEGLAREFEQFWQAYPRKVNRGRAFSAFAVARKTESFEQLLATARRYAAENSGKKLLYVARPENWLADQRWLDETDRNTVPDDRPETGPALPFESPDHWRHRMRIWFDEQHGGPTRPNWPKEWGPMPGDSDCRVPPDVLAEFRKEA